MNVTELSAIQNCKLLFPYDLLVEYVLFSVRKALQTMFGA